ncbi:MAG: hypothetical protein ACRBG0_27765 [Lewinella sp.]|uniref:hypothetical protein n=1 Tax=Lewinella sp. TaxID=2004506 RepID=UPI003D6C6942
MATNWTDATLYEPEDVVLPAILEDATTTYYQDYVKNKLGAEINYKFSDYPNFDIEEISNPEQLKFVALEMNLLHIAKQISPTMQEDDTFIQYMAIQNEEIVSRIPKDISALNFDEPDGINERKTYSIPITR